MFALSAIVQRWQDCEYTRLEASAITGVPVESINQFMSRDLAVFPQLVVNKDRKTVSKQALLALRIVFDFNETFQSDKRIEMVRAALANEKVRSIPLDGGKVVAKVDQSRAFVQKGLSILKSLKSQVASRDDVLSGEPCLKGTRLSVYTIYGIAGELGENGVKEAYPQLSSAQIQAACAFSKMNPRRGRPPRSLGEVLANTKAKAKTRSTRTKIIA